MPSLFLLLGRWSFCCSSPHFRGSEVVMTNFIDWFIFSVHWFFSVYTSFWKSLWTDTLIFFLPIIHQTWQLVEIHFQYTLISKSSVHWWKWRYLTDWLIFSVHWLYVKLMIGGSLFSVYTVIFQCKHCLPFQSEPGNSKVNLECLLCN